MKVGIIGAGLAGLAAANELRTLGFEAVVFDKGRGPGGRSSTRRAKPFHFDHGAQYLTARDPVFQRALSGWLAAGVAARWQGRLVCLHADATKPVSTSTERFVGVPGMSAIAKYLAREVDVRCQTRVTRLERGNGCWNVFAEGGTRQGRYDQIIVTTPAAQAAALLAGQSDLADSATKIAMRPCWSVMLGLSAPFEVSFDGAFCQESSLSWVARNNSKPARGPAEAWVLHATPRWTDEHLEEEPERVVAALTAEFERLTGRSMGSPLHSAAHHWRFALPETECEQGFLQDKERGLVLAGDAYCGGRIEGAYLSGAAAARAVVGLPHA